MLRVFEMEKTMTSEELAKKLSEMYTAGAKRKEKATMVHLFSIKYAEEINQCGVSSADIAALAKIPASYGSEIRKGINLSKYIQVK